MANSSLTRNKQTNSSIFADVTTESKDTLNEIEELKTSPLDRRLSIAKTSLNIGRRWASNSFGGLFMNQAAKTARNQEFRQAQAEYLVEELGKLKGSVVKIGQMLALYGEHFLSPEITAALHSLNDNTASLSWSVIEPVLRTQLGSAYDDLEIDHTPIGTASLAQVHRARIKSNQKQVVLKVQYPGVAEAIDSDLSLFKHLLKVTNAVPQTKVLDDWFHEIRDLLKVEVKYSVEAETTKRFYNRLKDDDRYIVPEVIDAYSTDRLLCLSFEEGIPVTDVNLKGLSQQRRDLLGQAAIDIMLNEIFVWGEMQTDPNFGNYLIRLAPDNVAVDNLSTNRSVTDKSLELSEDTKPVETDKLILLDFGAIRQFDAHLLEIARSLILAGFYHDKQMMIQAMHGYDFFDRMSLEVKTNLADVFLLATEPFRDPSLADRSTLSDVKLDNTQPADISVFSDKNLPTYDDLIDDNGNYHWSKSHLHRRIMALSGNAMQSREFNLPPKEFMFISRKFIGAYTFLTVLNARTNTHQLINKFVPINE